MSQYKDDVLDGLKQTIEEAKEKPYGDILAAKLLYAITELPYPTTMAMAKEFVQSADLKREVYSDLYSGRISYLVGLAYEQVRAPTQLSQTAQRLLFYQPTHGEKINKATGELVVRFLCYGWPNVQSQMHEPLLSQPIPYFRFVANLLYEHYASGYAVAKLERKVTLSLPMIMAMLKWGLGHRIDLDVFPEAVPLFAEFLRVHDRENGKHFAVPRIRALGHTNGLDDKEFGGDMSVPAESLNRAALNYLVRMARTSPEIQSHLAV